MGLRDIIEGLMKPADIMSPQERLELKRATETPAAPPPPVMNQDNSPDPNATVQLPNGRWGTPREYQMMIEALRRRNVPPPPAP